MDFSHLHYLPIGPPFFAILIGIFFVAIVLAHLVPVTGSVREHDSEALSFQARNLVVEELARGVGRGTGRGLLRQ